MSADPVESIIATALRARGIPYLTESQPGSIGLDFLLTDYGVHIECKRFHSPRISEQMSRAPDVIAIQGMAAAELFAALVMGGQI